MRVVLIERDAREDQREGDAVLGQRREQHVDELGAWGHLPASVGRGRVDDRPVEGSSGGDECQVLEHVQPLVAERCVVKRRQVPDDHDHARDHLRRYRLGDCADPRDTDQARDHARRKAEQEERWRDKREQHVLEHVDAVQVVVAEGVDWRFERDPQGEQPGEKVDGVLALGVVRPTRLPGVTEVQQDQPCVHGQVERPRRQGPPRNHGVASDFVGIPVTP